MVSVVVSLARPVSAGDNRIADFDWILEERKENMMLSIGFAGAIVAVIGVGLVAYGVITIFFSACDDIKKIRQILEKKPKRRKR